MAVKEFWKSVHICQSYDKKSSVLFFWDTVYCTLTADVIAHHGVQYHQYADDTQLHLAMRADNTTAGLSVLAECTTDVRQRYLQNGLQLNPDKSDALIVRITNQLRAVTSSVSMAGVDLPVADEIKSAGGHARSTSGVSQACLGSGAIMQFPCTGINPCCCWSPV